MNATPHLGRELPTDRIDRQAAYFRELSELNMSAARTAAARIAQANADDADTHKPTLDLAGATRAVVNCVDAENRLFRTRKHAEPPPRAPASDTRRAPLHKTLHKAAEAEPDPAVRAELHRQINTGIDATLVADPDAEIPLYDHVSALAKALHLSVDMTKVSDEILGIEHRIYPQPGAANPAPTDQDTGDPRLGS